MSPQLHPCPSCGKEIRLTSEMCRACRFPKAKSDDRPFPMNGQERKEYGCTCTFENADGKLLVLARVGAPSTTLRELCDEAVRLDGTFRLVGYSTPTTIYTDLQGARMGITGDNRAVTPEALALAQIGMQHMLHARMVR